MQKKSSKIIIIAVAFLLVVGFGILLINNYQTKTSFKYNDAKTETLKPEKNKQDAVSEAVIKNAKKPRKIAGKKYKSSGVLQVEKSDHTLGNKNAPIVMIEYASLSCPHCAAFNRESFGRIKEKYIDSGEMLFVFRNFPLNQPALVASMFASCIAKDDNDKYFKTIKNLFKTQDAWAFDASFEKRLEALSKLEGMSGEDFQKCINDDKLKQEILTDRIAAAKSLNMKSVPSFFINGELASGYVDYVTLEKAIEKKLSK